MSAPVRGGKLRAYLEFIAAVLYFFVVRSFARNAAIRIQHDAWAPLVEQILFVVLLVLGYAAFGSLFDRQSRSIAAQGLPLRPGWTREVGDWHGGRLGRGGHLRSPHAPDRWHRRRHHDAASSWRGCSPMPPTSRCWLSAKKSPFAVTDFSDSRPWLDRLARRSALLCSTRSSTLFSPGTTNASIAISVVFSFLLTTAYLRTRALWLSWGLNFGWKASQALIFG